MRVALCVTCLADTLYPDVGKATVRLLERLGHQGEFPEAQTCCGQMHVNTGYLRDALPLVRRYAEGFGGYEAIVVPSGSCTGSVRPPHPLVGRRHRGPRPPRRGLHGGGQSLPDAHRGRAVPADRRPPDRPPGRDPRLPPGLTGARSSAFLPPPGEGAPCAATSRSRWRPAGRSPTPSSAATSARPPPPSGPNAQPWWPSCRTGRSCARPGGRSRLTRCSTSATT